MKTFVIIILLLTFISLSLLLPKNTTENQTTIQTTPNPTISSTPFATPSPKPLTREEMEKQFGPCAVLPVFYYHHIETKKSAFSNGHTSLFVDTNNFKSQIQDLLSSGYTIVNPDTLISFFDANVNVTPKSAIITFDDGYEDLYSDAFPIIKELNIKVTIFIPTGLVNNKGYLSWDQIIEMKDSGLVNFANHTWSHKSMSAHSADTISFEIGAAETQLTENKISQFKIFAYPYGEYSNISNSYLINNGYKLAFSTKRGSLQCKGQRYFLPRIGARNTSKLNY